jgi:hypothetical protein
MSQVKRPTRELPGWIKAAIFAATLLAVSWLMMWMDAASR